MAVVSRFVWIIQSPSPVNVDLDTLWQAMGETAAVNP